MMDTIVVERENVFAPVCRLSDSLDYYGSLDIDHSSLCARLSSIVIHWCIMKCSFS